MEARQVPSIGTIVHYTANENDPPLVARILAVHNSEVVNLEIAEGWTRDVKTSVMQGAGANRWDFIRYSA